MFSSQVWETQDKIFRTADKETALEARSMSLTFSGKQGSSQEFETLLAAFDGDKRVVVVSSQEAIDDNGLPVTCSPEMSGV